MAAASIEGITIKIGCDVSDLKKEMSETTEAIKTVGTETEKSIKSANEPVEQMSRSFLKTAVSAQTVAKYATMISKTLITFTKGVVDDALEISPLTAALWNQVSDSFDELKLALGTAILPFLQELAPLLTSILNHVTTFLKDHPDLAAGIMGLATALAVVGSVLSLTAPLAIAFGVSVMTIAGPAFVVIAVFLALIAVGVLLRRHWGEITEWFKTKAEELKTKFTEIKTSVGEWKDSMIEKFSLMKTSVNGKIDEMKTKFDEWKTKVNLAKVNLGTFKDSVVAKFESIKTAITDALKGLDLIQAGKDFVSSIGEGIKAGIESIRDTVQGWFLSLIPDWAKQWLGIGGGGDSGAGGGTSVGNPTDVFRAGGGPVSANRPYIIGEVGPELFVPQTNGYVVPNEDLADYGTTINVNLGNVYGESYLRDYVISAVTGAIRQEVRMGA